MTDIACTIGAVLIIPLTFGVLGVVLGSLSKVIFK